nr:PREDICTED: uncharacterized protein LOC105669613 [Linepithema humile]
MGNDLSNPKHFPIGRQVDFTSRICDVHFDADCFEMVSTKPRLSNVAVKQIRRLKKGSIPTKMLILGEKRKITNIHERHSAIDKQKEAKKIAANALHKVFTPGQIKMLLSSNVTRIKWSSKDIMSAIALLRSLSSKAYRYLRNVKKMPMPCTSTLNNWCGVFNVAPGILKDVLKIMVDKGRNLSTVEKLTVLTFDELIMGGGYDHPTPVELRQRLKWYILGKHSRYAISPMENIEEDNNSTLLIDIEDTRCLDTDQPCSHFPLDEDEIMAEEEEMLMHVSEEISANKEIDEKTGQDYNNVEVEENREEVVNNYPMLETLVLVRLPKYTAIDSMLNLDSYEPTPEEIKLLEDFEQIEASNIIETNALIYIAGYVAHRFRNTNSDLGVPTKTLSYTQSLPQLPFQIQSISRPVNAPREMTPEREARSHTPKTQGGVPEKGTVVTSQESRIRSESGQFPADSQKVRIRKRKRPRRTLTAAARRERPGSPRKSVTEGRCIEERRENRKI